MSKERRQFNGGAIYLDSYTGIDSKPKRTLYLHDNRDVIFQDNSATEGGALYLLSGWGTAYITNNDSVVFKDNLGGAIYSNSHVQIQGNDEVLFIGNGVGIEASSISLSTTAESDSSITIYDSIKTKGYLYLNTLTPEYNVEGGTANGVIRFSGTQSCNTVERSVQQGAGTVLIENGASLKVGGDFELNGGNLIVEHQLQQQMPVEIAGRMLVTDSSAKITFNLDSGITADNPLISVGGKLSMKNGCFVLETSSTEPQPMDVALLFVAGSLECNGKTYTYENDEWTTSSGGTRVSLKPEDLLFDPLTWDDSYTLRWEDRTLFYSYLNGATVTYKAKGYESDKTWWGNGKLSWYDVDKQKVLDSGSTGSSAGINQDGDLSCWIAVACNMIQYWQDKYAPLYPGSRLITPTKRASDYRVLYNTLRSTAVVEGADKEGSVIRMLSLWFANSTTSTIKFKKNKRTAWPELGFKDGRVVELFNYKKFRDNELNKIDSPSEKNEELKKKVQGIFEAWSKKAYSPIALSFGDGKVIDGKAIGHGVTVWEVKITGDELTLTYTDSDCVINSPSTMKAMFVDGELIITEYQMQMGKDPLVADSNNGYMMPRGLTSEEPAKWTISELNHIRTPEGVDEMLKDYYEDNEYYWTGKRDTLALDTDASAPKDRLADASAGWMKKCDSASFEKSVWVNAYLKDSNSKLIFIDNIHENNKLINLPESLNVSDIVVSGKGYCLYNIGTETVNLTSERMSVSGGLNLAGNLELSINSLDNSLDVSGSLRLGTGTGEGVRNDVKIKADKIHITGSLDLFGVDNQAIVALDGCPNITLDGTGELTCIKLKLQESKDDKLQESKDDNKNLIISITPDKKMKITPDIKMKNCIVTSTSGTSTSGTISYIVSSSSDLDLSQLNRQELDNQVLTLLKDEKYGNNTIKENYKYKYYIDKTNASVNDSTAKGMNLGLSGSTLEVLQDGLSPETLSFGSTGVFNASSTADIAISESAGATLLAGASPLLTLPGEEVYLPDATVIEAPELTVSEDSTLENHGSLADVDSLVVEYDGVLSGNGVFGGTTVYEGGRVMVGGSPGAPVYDSLSMLSGSELVFCLDGSKPASAAENGWGSGTHSLLTVTQADGLTLESGTAVLVGCSLDFLNSVTVGDTQTLTLVQLGSAADAALLAALQSGTEFKLANADDSLEALSSVGALVHSTSWAQGGNNTLTLSFIVSSCPENALVWTDASGNGTWDSAFQNWAQQDGTAALFSADRNVLITRGGSINLAEMLSVGDVVVSSRDNLVLAGSGSLGGDGSLVKEGRGELSITTANAYSGGTYVNGGKLKVLHAEALGLGGVLLQGGELEIGVNGVDNALVNNAVSRLTIAPGVSYALPTEIYNSGELTISGTLNADALTDAADFAATRLDAAGNEGAHGFVRAAGSKVVVVSGAGTLDAAAATVTRDGKDYVLGSDGIAVHGMEVHGGSYLAGSGHSVKLSEVVTAAATHGASATDVLLSGGSLTADRALTGTLSASGTSSLVAENWVVSSSFTNAGTLSISGSIVADGMTTESIAATRVDVNGNTGAHGFVKNAGSRFTLVDLQNGGSLDIGALSITRNGTDYLLGNDGVALAEGSVECSAYLIGPGHEVKLSRVVQVAADHGVASTDVALSGGSLTADRALTGTLTASGTSSLVAENWVVNNSFTNEGNLSISGSIVADGMTTESIAATRVDVNGNTGAHGFVKNAGSRFTLVDLQNGGSLDIGALSITRNGTDYLLGNDGVALAEGSVECSAYLIGPGHEVKLSRVVAAAATHGASATDVLLSGGSLTADRALTGTLTASGTSSLVAENWAVNNSFTNEGNLSIRGSIVADGINCEPISATHVDVNGNIGEHGFAKDAGSKFTLVQLQHGGSLDIGSLSITRDGTDYTLQADGTAHAGEATHYGRYTIGTGHEVRLSQVAAAAGNHGEDSTHIDLAGGTLIADRALTGQLKCIGNSTLKAENWAVSGSLANEGLLSISGSIVADGATTESIAATYVDVNGDTGESGFARDAGSKFTLVQLQHGGSLDIGSLSITRDGTDYTLQADGTAHAGEATHYGRYTIGTGHEVRLSQVAAAAGNHGEDSTHIDLAGGTLIADRALTGQLKCIGNSTLKAENWAVSGSFTNEGTLSISGSIVADGMTAESIAATHVDVDGNTGANGFSRDAGSRFTLVQLQNGGSLEVGELTLSRQGMNYTLGADGVAVAEGLVHYNHYLAGNGHRAAVSDIVRVAARHGVNCTDIHLQGGTLAADAPITGALTLGGGSIELDGRLTVQGDVTFESGTQTTLDLSGWSGADDGEVLVDFGSSTSGYTEESLKLSGITGEWKLDFDAATGVLTLVEVKDEPLPEPGPEPVPGFSLNLNRNQTTVYNTIRNYGTPAGLLGELAKEIMDSRDEAQIKQLLDELGGAEYATLMSGQQAAASGHMRRLRGEMGSGHQLAGTKTRAYIEAYNHRSELDGDASGRGYELSESGGQFALEFIGEGHTSGGFAVAAGRSKLQPDGGLTQKSDNTYVDAFVMHRDGAYTGKFSLGVGVHKYDLDRRVAGNAVSADTSGSSVNFMHESAYGVSLAESHSVQVFGAVESSFNKLGAFHEKGADTASLQVESQDAWVTTLSVGARYLYSFAALESAPAATLSLQGGLELDFGDTESEVEMNFEGARSHSFRQSGAERDTFGYNLGASLHLPVSAKAAIYASGDAVLRGDSYEVNANVGLQMAF